MKRRDFLKLIAVSPLVPSVLCAKRGLTASDIPRVKEYFEMNECKDDLSTDELYNTKWFTLTVAPEYENIVGIQEWVQDCEDRLNRIARMELMWGNIGATPAFLVSPAGYVRPIPYEEYYKFDP
ncbi:MAG: hypothetical protein GWO38_23210 [Phycisphaerae bacterium]|nr:hypothetical protein [Phycisphaerae bacterium]NIP54457.1 hypothetical protein [Phycisphaerae bacterium]NIX01521.1 hypothetical protein [Phycisphaerae bacterium]NIX30464.1 hypothetical protein [Phycisphaerae bacterium]